MCDADRIKASNCNAATQLTEEAGMTVLFAMNNVEVKNKITMVALRQDSSKRIIFAFSGTQGYYELISEIVLAFPVKYSIHPEVKHAQVVGYFYEHYKGDFRESLRSLLAEYSITYANYELIFTGHSLGGALAVHAAADVLLSNWNGDMPVSIYNFGQPRVSNHYFTESIKGLVKEWFRLVHNRDIVAHIPPCVPSITTSCSKGGILPFYPYHSPEEIYYNEGRFEFI